MHLVSLKARERSGVDPGSFNSNDGIDATKGSPETSQHDMLRGFPSLYKSEDDEFKIMEPDPLSESELKETTVTGQGGDAQSATACDDSTVFFSKCLCKVNFLNLFSRNCS